MIVARGPGRPRRPELRLPGAQGDPQGRRRRAAVEAGPARARSSRRPSAAARRYGAGDDQDAHGHRRRPPDLPRRRAHRAEEGAVRRSPCTRAPPSQRYAGQADWDAIAALARSSTPTSRCSATATSGAPTTRCAMVRADRLRRRRRRPRLPGPAVAVRRPRGRLRRCVVSPEPTLGGCGRAARHTVLLAEFTGEERVAAATCASTSPGTSRGSPSHSRSGPPWARWAVWRSSTGCSRGSIPTSSYPSVVAAGLGGYLGVVLCGPARRAAGRASGGGRGPPRPLKIGVSGQPSDRVRGLLHPGRALPG